MLIFHLSKERATKSIPSRTQKTSPSSGGKNTQEQRSCAPNQDNLPSNYRFNFCSFGTKIISVCGWRFAPACCAAQSVIRRGPGCAVPLHRLPWAAQNLHSSSGLHQQNASAAPINAVHNLSPPSFSRPDGCGLTGRSTGHFAAVRVRAIKA